MTIVGPTIAVIPTVTVTISPTLTFGNSSDVLTTSLDVFIENPVAISKLIPDIAFVDRFSCILTLNGYFITFIQSTT
ncbi:hypothetical protein K7432_012564 [Basidiobolus ranarum]|uniref:Uncharacterized protein n=1 Tax=Basidiobolus ranarum TaxID=34480 RepID=A0ABR2WKL3_9FUNG